MCANLPGGLLCGAAAIEPTRCRVAPTARRGVRAHRLSRLGQHSQAQKHLSLSHLPFPLLLSPEQRVPTATWPDNEKRVCRLPAGIVVLRGKRQQPAVPIGTGAHRPLLGVRAVSTGQLPNDRFEGSARWLPGRAQQHHRVCPPGYECPGVRAAQPSAVSAAPRAGGKYLLLEIIGGAAETRCDLCLNDAACAAGVTLETLSLNVGSWRLGVNSTELHSCLNSADGFTPCLGGNSSGELGAGYCVSGHKARSAVCSNEGYYFSEPDAKCLVCPPPANVAGVLVAIAVGVSLAVLAVWAALRPRRDAGAWHRATILFLRRAQQKMSALGLMPKLKLLIAFYQSVTLLPNVYNVQLPPRYMVDAHL